MSIIEIDRMGAWRDLDISVQRIVVVIDQNGFIDPGEGHVILAEEIEALGPTAFDDSGIAGRDSRSIGRGRGRAGRQQQ